MEVEVNGRIFSRVFDVELTQGLVRVNVGDIGTTFDEYANRFGARLLDGGEPVDTSSMTVTGYFLRPNRDTVPIQGRTQTGMVYVDLSPSCYSYDGEFTLVVKVLNGESIGTVLIVDGRIPPSRSDSYIADEESFPDIERIEEMINELEESVDAVLTLNDRVVTLESGIATANSNITKAQNTANDATTKANTANSGVSALDGRVTTLESGISSTNSKIDSVESKADENATAIADVDAKADENADAIAEVDAKADANASSIASVDAKTKTNANNITALTTRVSNAEKNITSANNSISSASQRITAVETKANNNASDISNLETTVEGNSTRIAELDSGLETATNKADNAKQAADNNKALIETVQSTLNETINGIRDENSTQTARINAAADNITALQNNALMKSGHTANKWLSTDSRGNVVTVDGPDAEVTAESIAEALGYTPADAANVEVTASSIKKALGYTPAGVNDLLEVEVELKRDKLDNSGHEKGKYLGTDAYGRVVTVEPPSVGSTPVSGPYQMLVSDKDGNTVWEERTHYPYIGRVTVLPEVEYKTIEYDPGTISHNITDYMQGPIVADKTYYITFGDEEMECLAYADGNTGMTVLAENNDVLMGRVALFYYSDGKCLLSVNDGDANPNPIVKVEGPGIAYKKIDKVYLPDDIGSGGDGIQILHGVVDGTKITFDKTLEEICNLARDGELSKYKILVDAQAGKTVEMSTVNWWEEYTGEEIQLSFAGTFYDVAAGLPKEAWVSIYKSRGEYSASYNDHNIANLPEPNSSYEGKVLGVEGGHYAFIDMPSGGIGGGGASLLLQIVDEGGTLIMMDTETGEPITGITPEVIFGYLGQGAQITFIVMSTTDTGASLKMYSISELGENADGLYAILGNHGNGTPIMMAADGTLNYQS